MTEHKSRTCTPMNCERCEHDVYADEFEQKIENVISAVYKKHRNVMAPIPNSAALSIIVPVLEKVLARHRGDALIHLLLK